MDIKTRRRLMAVLQALKDETAPLGSQRIAEILNLSGLELGERTIRNYLALADQMGWTENLGRRGRRLTAKGSRELDGALVMDKVGFVLARVDSLSYQMDFDLATRHGRIILNISTIAPHDLSTTLSILTQIYEARLGMGRYLALGGSGEWLGGFRVPEGCVGIGTMCGVSINGTFLRANIATTSRFGGLVQMEGGAPKRFTQIITYDGSSLDPLEIFIRGHMTSVGEVARSGSGMLGASFREIPMVALPEVQRIIHESEQAGIYNVLAVGMPNQPLLDIPVAQGRVGVVVSGGLNPIAAVVEAGIPVTSAAMSTLCPFEALVEYNTLPEIIAAKGLDV